MNILVTGGAGFIGRHLVASLVDAGERVTVLDNLKRSERSAVDHRARFVEGDVRDTNLLASVVKGSDLIYHLAAQSNVLGAVADLDYSFSTNVAGTFELLKAARSAGVRRVVFTSSREVYGEQRVLPVSETAPPNAKNAYGASKLAGEAYCRALSSSDGLQCTVLRLANVYGAGDHARVIPLWLNRAANRQDLVVYGGQQVIDFVPVETVVLALRAASTAVVDGPVNVGSGRGTPLMALADRIRSLAGSAISTVVEPARDAEVVRFVADTTRMRDVLGIEPPVDPLCGLAALWESIHARPSAA